MSALLKKSKPRYKCSHCSKRFNTKGGLNNHVKSHFPDQFLLQCPYCEFTSFQKGNLSKHMISIHKRDIDGHALTEQYNCEQCYAQFSTDLQLKTHVARKHTIQKDHKCQLCSYSAVEKADLLKHIRICHTNERPYPCEGCDFKAHTSSGLARHMRSHSNAKPFKCSVCGADYADKKRLREHLMKHSNLKPFSCDSCQYSTNRKDNLKTHIRRCHTGGELILNLSSTA